ncbi:class I SAM-dependent methyltransferase [Streptomyces olivoreticuli]|uniref:class I SAM-dependent methyltransferase n=1 Tax=Streptomyces olivoreticuli TaxID=68246 RepID=UPI003462490A
MVETGENTTRSGMPLAVSQSAAAVQPYYVQNAGCLGQRYASVPFEKVHGGVLDLLPPAPARAVDVGAGTGRDAAALARRGYRVVAVEPVGELREASRARRRRRPRSWVKRTSSRSRCRRARRRWRPVVPLSGWWQPRCARCRPW